MKAIGEINSDIGFIDYPKWFTFFQKQTLRKEINSDIGFIDYPKWFTFFQKQTLRKETQKY